ncbi:MAG TPA: hypothetical protein PLV92_17785, partial [Pirellulaceae bacterium]|nr:hypothetical protein [Pirellulaceae bacterium]
FAGRPEGSRFSVPGTTTQLYVTYRGGDGNDVMLATNPVITGSDGVNDSIVVRLTANHLNVEASVNGAAFVDYGALADMTLISVLGFDGHDVVTIDLVNGNPLPSEGMNVVGGANSLQTGADASPNSQTGDALRIVGTGAESVLFTPDSLVTGKGVITIGGRTLNFEGLDSFNSTAPAVELSNFANVQMRFPHGSTSDGETLTIGQDTGVSTTSFSTPTLVVSGQAAGGTTFAPLALACNQLVDIDTSSFDGADTIHIAGGASAHANQSVRIVTGAGNDSLDVPGQLTVAGALTINTKNVTFNGGRLTGSGGGSTVTIDVTGAIASTTSAVDVAGPSVTLRATTGVTVDAQVGSLTIVNSTSGNVTFTATGGLTGLDVDAGAGAVSIAMPSGSLLDSDAAIDVRAASLVVTSSGGDIGSSGLALQTAVDRLEGQVQGSLWIIDADALQIGGATGAWSGLSTIGGDVNVVAGATGVGGSLNITENVGASGAGADIFLSTTGVASGGQNIVVRATSVLSASSGIVSLVAADDLTIESGSRLVTTGTVSLTIDGANDDPGVGGILEFAGDIDAATALIFGNATDADQFHVRPDQDATSSERTKMAGSKAENSPNETLMTSKPRPSRTARRASISAVGSVTLAGSVSMRSKPFWRSEARKSCTPSPTRRPRAWASA